MHLTGLFTYECFQNQVKPCMQTRKSSQQLSEAQVGFNVRYWLHCQFFLLCSQSFLDNNQKSEMTSQWRNYSSNLRKFVHKNCATRYWLQISFLNFFLKVLDQQCHKVSKGYLSNFSTELSSQIFDCCPRNFLIQKETIGNVVSTSHWITPVRSLTVFTHRCCDCSRCWRWIYIRWVVDQ